MAMLAARTLSTVDEVEQEVEHFGGEVEHFLGHEDVFHGILIGLGVIAIAFSAHKRLPEAIAVVGSMSLGLWVSLLVHDWQVHGTPFNGTLPGDWWIPIVACIVTSLVAGLLAKTVWKAGLVLLSAMLISFVVLAVCRLFSLPVETLFDTDIKFLSTYRVLGIASLLVALVVCCFLVRRRAAELLLFSTVHLATLLLLSGASHFAERFIDEDPFSLIDNLAHILTEVYENGCDGDGEASSECDCQIKCKAEIVAWILLSWLISLALLLIKGRSNAKVSDAKEGEARADSCERIT